MNQSGKTITKNAGVMMISQIITWGMSILLMVFLPRYLGAEGNGKLALAISLWAIAGVLITFGMDTFLTREIARDPKQAGRLFSNSIFLRTLLFGISLVTMAAYLWLASYPTVTNQVIYAMGIATLFSQYASACRATLNGLERMEYVSISEIVSKGVTTIVGIVLLLMGYQVAVIAAVSILGSFTNLSIQFLALRRVLVMQLFRFNLQLGNEILKNSFAFMIMGGFLIIYAQVDVVIISWLVPEEQLGWYAAADRLFATMLFIPTVYLMAVFPALSRLQAEASSSFKKLTRISFDLLLLIAMPMGLGLLVIANQLVVLIFGPDFANSGPILMAFGVVLILTYQNVLIGMTLIASDRQNPWTRIIIIATLLSIPLDLILIPLCQQLLNNGAIGGALAFILTESFMLIAGLRLLPAGTLNRRNLSAAARTVLAGMIMVAATWWLRDVFIAIPILVGAVVYLVCVFGMRLISPETWDLFRSLSAVVKQRFGGRRAEMVSKIAK